MLNLNREGIKDRKLWQDANIELPRFDTGKMAACTAKKPTWIHFGAGNLFRGFIAALQQTLLDNGKAETGIIAVESYDHEIIDRIYSPYDSLALLVTMQADGALQKKVIGSISEGLVGDFSRENDWNRLNELFKSPSLQMVTFTVTEKGYGLRNPAGDYYEDVRRDLSNGPSQPGHLMAKVTSLAYTRYKNGAFPIAFVSMDNCSHNGEKLQSAVVEIAGKWVENGFADKGFLGYIGDPNKVSFPWSMIDKITPRPSETVRDSLGATGFKDTEIICTAKKTYIAPFVNAEEAQYLVVEDSFPNGRLPLEAAGVYFTDRQTVDKADKMKVCTCLNPLHTALAVFGCLLGYTGIADEMKDITLEKLVEKLGFEEGLPVVADPGIINPEEFIRKVIEERFPNPYIPDTPQRIATDTSLKIGIRFGETIKSYKGRKDLEPSKLICVPLVIAGWFRYLLGVDDSGEAMQLSPDPMLEELRMHLSGIKLGNGDSIGDSLKSLLSNERIFGSNLYEVGLGEKVEGYLREMTAGKHAVRTTLEKYLK